MWYIPTDTGGANVHTDLTGSRFRIRFLNEMNFVLGVAEGCYVRTPRRFLAFPKYLEFRMVQRVARMIHLSVAGTMRLIDPHGDKC
jgi:hypothetical protein